MPTRNYIFAPGDVKHFGAGNEIRIIEAPGEVTVKVFKNNTEIVSERAEGVKAGLSIRPQREPGAGFAFEDSTVESATAQTVKIFTTKGESRYDRSVGEVSLANSQTASDAADIAIATTITDVIAALSSRRELHIQADPANPGFLRMGPNASAIRGVQVGPGAVFTFKTGAAIKVHNANAAGQTYSWVSIED